MTNYPVTILMADDDLEDLELMEEAIANYNKNLYFHKVHNGKEVLEFLNSKSDDKLPKLLLLDYNMPELNGSEVLHALSKDRRYDGMAKIVFSTSNTPTHIADCKNNGATEYFIKPTNTGDLKRIVEKLVSYCRA